MAQQGIGWVARRAIGIATVTLRLKQYIDDQGITHIDIDQLVTGGFKGTTELRTLNWTEVDHTDHLFGQVRGKSRWIKLADVKDEFMKTGWAAEMNGTEAVQSYVESVNGWTADQLWGFEVIAGERRYVRHIVVVKGKERKAIKLVYDLVKKS